MGILIRSQYSISIAAAGAVSLLSGKPSSFFAMADIM